MEETASTAAPRWPRGAAVIGAGTMGLGVAEYLAAAGVRVCISEATPELARRAQGHVEAGLLTPEAIARVAEVEAADNVTAAVRDVDLVFEAVPEKLELKLKILATCSGAASSEGIIVSNTSSLSMDEL